MLRKAKTPAEREAELKALDEYVKAGKVTKLSYVDPKDIEYKETQEEREAQLDEDERELIREAGREELGDGNFRLGERPWKRS